MLHSHYFLNYNDFIFCALHDSLCMKLDEFDINAVGLIYGSAQAGLARQGATSEMRPKSASC